MPNTPDRPGKHRAAHKAARPSRLRYKFRAPHLAPLPRPAVPTAPARMRRHIGTAVALGGVLVAGAAVSGSTLNGTDTDQQASSTASAQSASASAERADGSPEQVSRGGERERRQASRAGARSGPDTSRPDRHSTASEPSSGGTSAAERQMPDDPREIAKLLLSDYGWDSSEFECLDELWIGESNWDVKATNPTSGAYGIPQSLPPEKMAAAGDDWETNPVTQIEWGLDYIEDSYGTPCSANEFKNGHNWY